jgi:hypothetical protein
LGFLSKIQIRDSKPQPKIEMVLRVSSLFYYSKPVYEKYLIRKPWFWPRSNITKCLDSDSGFI